MKRLPFRKPTLRRAGRFFAIVAAGGCLFQVVGCLSGLAPVWVSFGESALVSYLFSILVG